MDDERAEERANLQRLADLANSLPYGSPEHREAEEDYRDYFASINHVDTYLTRDMEEQFSTKNVGFGVGYIAGLVRKSDGARGSLEFCGTPRLYYRFVEHK